MKDAENGKEPDFIPLATLTSDTAKSVKALLAAASTLKLKESSLTQELQTKMRALHVCKREFDFLLLFMVFSLDYTKASIERISKGECIGDASNASGKHEW